MTREEAIEICRNIMPHRGTPVFEALDMAIEALERPTARWERYVDDYIKCSKCERIVKFYHYNYKYCPHCGAKMQEVEE